MEQPAFDWQRINGQRLTRLALPFSERRLLLIGLDLVAVNGALLLTLALGPEHGQDWRLLTQHPRWFLLLGALWLPLAYAFDAYDLRAAGKISTAAQPLLKSGLLTVLIYLLIPYLTPPLPSSRLALSTFPLLTLALLLVGRGIYVLALAQPIFRRRALIVGTGRVGRAIAQTVAEHCDGSYQVVGFVDDDPAGQDGTLHAGEAPNVQGANASTFKVVGDRYALPGLVSQHHVTTLILAVTGEVNGKLLQVLMDCLELGAEIIPMTVLSEQLTGRVPVEHVGADWYVAMPINHPGTGTLYPLIKRLTDVVLGSLGLFFLLPLLPFLALAIYLDSPGPIFYGQERVGQGGRRFWIYKFRSMVPNAETVGAAWAQQDDYRVTRVGRILRRTHMDEFPQFFNILRGEMSVVGPRPERPEFAEWLAREIPFYRVRHAVKPGMAGWGLVRQGYGASKEDALIKLQYDLYYIKHQSLWLDMVILLKTIASTIALRGR